MALRHLIILAMLAGFAPVITPVATIDKRSGSDSEEEKEEGCPKEPAAAG